MYPHFWNNFNFSDLWRVRSDDSLNHAYSKDTKLIPVISIFWSVFHTNPFYPATPCDDIGIKRCGILIFVKSLSHNVPLLHRPSKSKKNVFSILSSQETDSSSISSKMIFGALQIEQFRFKIHSLNSKILKFLEFNLRIAHWSVPNIYSTRPRG